MRDNVTTINKYKQKNFKMSISLVFFNFLLEKISMESNGLPEPWIKNPRIEMTSSNIVQLYHSVIINKFSI